MNRTKKGLLAAAALPLAIAVGVLTGCSVAGGTGSATADTSSTSSTTATDASATVAEVLADDQDWESDAAAATVGDPDTTIALSGSAAKISGKGAAANGDTVTITAGGTYRLTGTFAGQVVVAAGNADVTLILDDVSISSESSAAVAITGAGTVVVDLVGQSKLSDTSSYADDADVNAALFSAADMTITGTGSLTVAGNGNDGITSKDGLVIDSGTISVTAKDDGIRGKDYLVVSDGAITVDAGGDGLTSDNTEDAERGFILVQKGTLAITSDGDGVSAASDLLVAGGNITVSAGGGAQAAVAEDASVKGLKAGDFLIVEAGKVAVDAADDALHTNGALHLSGGTIKLASGDDGIHADNALLLDGADVTVSRSNEAIESADVAIAGGTVDVTASDDGLNASTGDGGEGVEDVSITISGGTTSVNAEGDGFDSNGSASMTGGTLTIDGTSRGGNGAIDVNGDFLVSGGNLAATDAGGMAVSPASSSSQSFVASTFDTQKAGAEITVVDSTGTVVARSTPTKSYSALVVSSSTIVAGDSYSLVVDGTTIATATAGTELSGGFGGGGGGGGGAGGGGGRGQGGPGGSDS